MTANERPAPTTETGPHENAPTLLAEKSTSRERRRDSAVPRPIPWARARIEAAGSPIPTYGSAEWHALPDGSRAKISAVVLAAECWRTYTDPAEVARRLRAELDAAAEADRLEAELDATWSPVLTRAHRRAFTRPGPSQAELARRRGEPEREARALAHETRIAAVMHHG